MIPPHIRIREIEKLAPTDYMPMKKVVSAPKILKGSVSREKGEDEKLPVIKQTEKPLTKPRKEDAYRPCEDGCGGFVDVYA